MSGFTVAQQKNSTLSSRGICDEFCEDEILVKIVCQSVFDPKLPFEVRMTRNSQLNSTLSNMETQLRRRLNANKCHSINE